MAKTKVLIIDDSALVRKMLTEMFKTAPDLEVVGSAADPHIAREKIKSLNPDVLTLDVEMPRMDGLTFLRNLMRLRPMPVLMISTLTAKGADVTLRALELGAVDFVEKPQKDLAHSFNAYRDEILSKLRAAARARVGGRRPARAAAQRPMPAVKPIARGHFKTTDQIVAIGASTGGTEAIKDVLSVFPPDSPPVVIAQHIPEAFSGPFAQRLDTCCAIKVQEARDGQQIMPGHAYIAPGNSHLLVRRDGARYVARLTQTSPVNRHRPSVDVLFNSVAENVGPNAVGVILTGMGADGARGLLEMKQAGAKTIAQDEKSCVVFGMPKEAIKLGGAEVIVSLDDVAARIFKAATGKIPNHMLAKAG